MSPSSPTSSTSSDEFFFFAPVKPVDNGLPPEEIAFQGMLYTQRQRLGAGGSASVWSYESPKGGKILAMKVFRNHNDLQGKFEYEYEIMNQIEGLVNHDHIIRYYGSTTIQREKLAPMEMLIFEYCPRSLVDESKTQIVHTRALALIHDVAEGLAELHRHGFMHRDVKLENLLIRDSDAVVLADFGEAARVDSSNWYCGTLNYMAPEIRQGLTYTNKIDIWALGCCIISLYGGSPFVSLLSGMDIFQAARLVLTEEDIADELDFVQHRMPSDVRCLAELCLRINPAERPSAEELLGEMEFMAAENACNDDMCVEEFDECYEFNEQGGICFRPQTITILPPSTSCG